MDRAHVYASIWSHGRWPVQVEARETGEHWIFCAAPWLRSSSVETILAARPGDTLVQRPGSGVVAPVFLQCMGTIARAKRSLTCWKRKRRKIYVPLQRCEVHVELKV